MGRLLGKVALTPAERSRRFRARKKQAAVMVEVKARADASAARGAEKVKEWAASGKLAKTPDGMETLVRNGVPFAVLQRTTTMAWICPVTFGPCLPECEGMCARQLSELRALAAERGQELVLVMPDEPGG